MCVGKAGFRVRRQSVHVQRFYHHLIPFSVEGIERYFGLFSSLVLLIDNLSFKKFLLVPQLSNSIICI